MQIDARLSPVSGQAMLLLPDFRRLFPQERLLPGESLEVSRVVLIFTDLAGSTALYAARGDPRAYHLVRLHFDELFAAADNHRGTVGKNIGDAVMAAFQTPAEALGAALEMQRRIAARVQGLSRGGDVVFTDAVRSDRDAQVLLEGQSLESSHVTLKGIEEQLLAHRMTVDGI